jgi:hypothetical protein
MSTQINGFKDYPYVLKIIKRTPLSMDEERGNGKIGYEWRPKSS